jgi:hypothetical protein
MISGRGDEERPARCRLGHQHVSESVLKTTISEVRAALLDDAKQPRYIETASRRGYRFICAVIAPQTQSLAVAPSAQQATHHARSHPEPIQLPPMIGRRTAIARLTAAWNQASAGRRQVFWVAGEAGVGKTTLIDRFVAELAPVVCAHGQCVEQFGAGENPARLALELALMLKRGVACSQLLGMSSKEARTAFERAQALCGLLPETPALGWALNGLGLVRYGDGDYRAAHALGERIQVLAERHNDSGLVIAASNLMGMSSASLGKHREAQQWLEQGVAVCEGLQAPPPHDRFFVDPGVSMRGHLGLHLLPVALFDHRSDHAGRSVVPGAGTCG